MKIPKCSKKGNPLMKREVLRPLILIGVLVLGYAAEIVSARELRPQKAVEDETSVADPQVRASMHGS